VRLGPRGKEPTSAKEKKYAWQDERPGVLNEKKLSNCSRREKRTVTGVGQLLSLPGKENEGIKTKPLIKGHKLGRSNWRKRTGRQLLEGVLRRRKKKGEAVLAGGHEDKWRQKKVRKGSPERERD